MPTTAVYPGGGTTYMPGGGSGTHTRGLRTEIQGWSASSTRRLRRFLWSVQPDELTGHGYAVTLTMLSTPPDAEALSLVVTALMKRYARLGLVRLQWVIEWQGRGTPHLHLAVYMAEELPGGGAPLVDAWLAVAEPYGAGRHAQDVRALEGGAGWFRYLDKHAGRSLKHYQRQGMPPGWTKTGRLWGYRGDWPTVDGPMRFEVDREGWFRLRRMVRAYRVAEARQIKDPRHRVEAVRKARQMLVRPEQKLSTVRGTSAWVPEHVQIRFLALLADQGHGVQQVD